LFFTDPPQSSFESAAQSDDIDQLWRVVVNVVAPHQLAARNQLEVLDTDIALGSIFENESMSLGNRTVRLFP
jgi:hypothetical protein